MRSLRLLIVLSVLCLAVSVHAATRYVSKSGGNTPPYTSWATAARGIKAAIAASDPGDTIIVGDGTYRPLNEIVVSNGLTPTPSSRLNAPGSVTGFRHA